LTPPFEGDLLVADHAVGAPLSANKSGGGRGTGLRQVVEGEIDLADAHDT
jgi:hypothetical protein